MCCFCFVFMFRFLCFFFFFFQAEDGIRDSSVTGVQTCALPISSGGSQRARRCRSGSPRRSRAGWTRSEERRVGKSVDLGGRRIIKKKKKIRECDRDEVTILEPQPMTTPNHKQIS